MACFNNWSVYDFYNMGQAVRKDMITGKEAFPYEFKYIKDIVATKVSMFSYKDLNKVIPEMTDSIIETAILSKEDEKYLKKLKKGLHESEQYVIIKKL